MRAGAYATRLHSGLGKRTQAKFQNGCFRECARVSSHTLFKPSRALVVASRVLLFILKGDTFMKLEDEDEQGWCKGQKDGVIGLYPKNYCEPV